MAYDILASKAFLHINDLLAGIKERFDIEVDRESLVSALSKRVARGDRFVRTAKSTFAQRLRDEDAAARCTARVALFVAGGRCSGSLDAKSARRKSRSQSPARGAAHKPAGAGVFAQTARESRHRGGSRQGGAGSSGREFLHPGVFRPDARAGCNSLYDVARTRGCVLRRHRAAGAFTLGRVSRPSGCAPIKAGTGRAGGFPRRLLAADAIQGGP